MLKRIYAVMLLAGFFQGVSAQTPPPAATNNRATTPVAQTQPAKNDTDTQKSLRPITLKPLIPSSSNGREIILPPPPPPGLEKEILPGIGYMPGEDPDLKNKVVKTGSERNEITYISGNYVNRIATPFRDPRVIDQSGADIKVDGSDVFIKPANPSPIAIYIIDDASRQTISMTLVPKNLPGQTIVAQLQTQQVAFDDKNTPIPEEYIGKLTTINLKVAQQKTPQGFTEAKLPATSSKINNLVVTPLIRYSGTVYDIYKYEIVSGYKEAIELKEETFYNDRNIRTISFFPSAVLEPAQKTYMFIVADKPGSEKIGGLKF